MAAQRRRVAERHAPFDGAAVQIHRHQMAVRRLEQRQPIHELRVGVADARVVGVHFRGARVRARAVGLPDSRDVRLVRRLEEQDAGSRVERAAAPIGAADQPGPLHGAAKLGGVNSGPIRYFCSSFLRRRLQLGREIERVVERHALLRERGRPGRHRLRRPGLLALDVARRHRPFLDRPHRLAGDAIEHEREPLLGQLHDGVDRPAVDANRDEVRRRRVVVVPQAVMDELVVPLAHAGVRIETDERLGEQIGAGAAAAEEVVARRAERHDRRARARRRASSAPTRWCAR